MKGIEKYLKTYVDELMFITINEHLTEQKKDVSFLKDVPIPISVKGLTEGIHQNGLDKIPFEAMIEGMIYTLGVDGDFPYKEAYKRFLFLANEDILGYILFRGVKFAEEEKYYEAVVHFRAALLLDEKNINAMINYGKCCNDIHDISKDLEEKNNFKREALHAFENILNIYPDYPEAYYYLGFLSLNQKMYQKTKILWNKFLKLSDDEDKKEEIMLKLREIEDYVTYEIGYTHILNGNMEKGLDTLLELEERYKEWWNLLFFIGLAYRNMGKADEAVDYFKRVLILKPSQLEAINELGLCYSSLCDYEKAEKYFKKALMLDPDNHEFLCNLGVVYMYTNQYEKAKETLEDALALAPNDEIVMQWMAKLEES